MRILLANEARIGGGGVETYLAALTPHLSGRGHEVALLYANPSAETGPTAIGASDSWSAADLGAAEACAGALAWQPDVIFSHNMRQLEIDERLTAARPTLKMMHGYFGTCVSGHKAFSLPSVDRCPRRCDAGCLVYYLPRKCGQLRPGVMTAQYRWARRQQRLFDRYAAIVVASGHMRDEYVRQGVDASSIYAVPLFAEPRLAPPRPPDLDIVFLGRMTPLKGPEVLLRAVRIAAASVNRPLHIAMAGDGPELPRLRRLAAESAAAVAIEFPGWVDAAARAQLLARTRLVAIPSRWPEPFGLVGLEAAAAGVPAVAFDVGGISEWLTHDVNGRLAAYDSGAAGLASAIAVSLGADVHRRLAAGAAETSRRLTADRHISELERLFSQVRAA